VSSGLRRFAVFICTFGYLGFFPFAPGTVGSLAGLALYLAARSAGVPQFELPLIVLLFVAGVLLTKPCEDDLRCVDPGPVVIDEVMGMLVTLFLIPVGWGGLLLGFVLFRVLDVVKPFPARQLERLHGGLGVMADDVMAGVYANVLVRGAYYLAPGWIG
jgi:phosphatidylglycerophosphatase A